MDEHLGFMDRAWVAPEVCSVTGGSAHAAQGLHGAIERAEDALGRESIGRIIHVLVALKTILRSRLASPDVTTGAGHERVSTGRWRRRLRKRYAASLCALEQLIEKAWGSFSLDEMGPAVRRELAKLRRIESLENEAQLALSWTDVGVGD